VSIDVKNKQLELRAFCKCGDCANIFWSISLVDHYVGLPERARNSSSSRRLSGIVGCAQRGRGHFRLFNILGGVADSFAEFVVGRFFYGKRGILPENMVT
jgi:hypothetical protein